MRSFVEWSGLEADLERGQARVSERGLMTLVRALLMPVAKMESEDSIGTQRAPGGRKWKPLKASTQRLRASLGYGAAAPINKRTGALEQFLNKAGTDITVAPEFVQGAWPALINQDSTRLMYAFYTAQGGSKRWGTPARPVVGLGPTGIAFLHGMTKTYVEQLLVSSNAASRLIESGAYKR